MGSLCISCKKSGRVWCPHNAALEIKARLSQSLKQEMFGPSPPSVFVGHNFYPNVYWGPMVSSVFVEDEPSKMYGMGLEKIIENRAAMVRGMRRGNVKMGEKMLLDAQEAVMSVRPVDVETRFSKKPVFSLAFDDVTHPVGASAPIEKFRVADNIVVPKRVDELREEGTLARQALEELLLFGFDVHYLSKLLSAGILGKQENRKLVPTKWAITATDDMAAKRLMESVRGMRELDSPCVYSNEYLDNHFEILLLPGNWEYEQFEALLTKEIEGGKTAGRHYSSAPWGEWKHDGRVNVSEEHEAYFGRSDYAKSQGGGYYAARYAVCSALFRMKRQARAIVFREIGTAYTVPVGVWEVRENVLHAFENRPAKFATREEAFEHLAGKLSVPLREYVKRSRILPQRRLCEF